MLLDMQRWSDAINRRFPPHSSDDPGLIGRMEQAIASYVRGQLFLSVIIGVSVGPRVMDPRPGRPRAERRALRRGVRRVGGHHGAHPVHRAMARRDAAGALRARPGPALGGLGGASLPRHPAVRGSRRRPERHGPSLRLHPLLVIFGLLAGGEIYGFPGSSSRCRFSPQARRCGSSSTSG